MSTYKQGDMVEACDDHRFNSEVETVELVWYGGGAYYCRNRHDKTELLEYSYIRAIKEPEYIEYTQETLPKGSLWLRRKGYDIEFSVQAVLKAGIHIDNTFWTYCLLLEGFDISEDGRRSYHTAGVEVKP